MATEIDDSLQSINYANILDLISEGEIEGLDDGFKSIFLDGTPVQDANGNNNFEGYEIQTRNGTQTQSYISALAANEIEKSSVVGLPVELTRGTGTNPNVTIRQITNNAASKVRVTITIPILRKIKDNGDIVGNSVKIKIRVQYSGGNYNLVKEDEIKCKSCNRYQRDYVFALTGSFPVNIEVSRISPDETNSRNNSRTVWSSITEIIDEKLSYPNSALVYLRLDSRAFSNIPRRKFLIRGVKTLLPSNAQVDTTTYLGRVTYTGVWDGTFTSTTIWHSDPSWHLYNLLINDRYGVGLNAATLDKFDFYTISQYCNELVDDQKGQNTKEVRFALNMVLNERKQIYEAIKELTSIFRGMTYYGGNSLVATQDSPQDSKYLLGAANVVNGNFEYTGTSQKARHTTCTISYSSYEKLGEIETEYVEDVDAVSKYGVINKQIKSVGTYSQGQAHRLGLWVLKSEQLLTSTVSFSVAVESGIVLRPNMVIEIADELKTGYRHTGYISTGSTTTVIKIDSSENISIDLTKNPEISILLSTGIVEKRVIQNINSNSITVASAFSEIPNAESVYILQSSEVQALQYRVIEISEKDNGIYDVIALQYNSSIYDAVDNGEPITVRNVTDLTAIPDPVTNIVHKEFLFSDGQSVFVGCDLSWQHNMKRVTEFKITYRVDDDNFATLTSSSPSISLRQGGSLGALRAGLLTVQIQAVNYLGKESIITTNTFTLAGKTKAPNQVQNFTMIPTNGLAKLLWTQSEELDVVVGGLVRLRHSPLLSANTWSNATSIHSDLTGTAKEAYCDLKEGTYFAKFVDSGGRTSVNAAYIEFKKPDLDNLQNVNTQTEHTNFNGTKTNVEVDSSELILSANGSVLHTTGTYLFANNPIDLGDVYSISLDSKLKVRSFFPNAITMQEMGTDFDPNAEPNTTGFAAVASFTGNAPDNADVKLYIRTTQTDPNSSPTWTTWRPFNNAEFKARGYELKAELETNDSSAQIAIQELEVTAKSPIRTITGTGTTSNSSDVTISFANKFLAAPAIGITFSASTTGEYYNISNTAANQFSVSIYNASNARQQKAFTWTATGYGKG